MKFKVFLVTCKPMRRELVDSIELHCSSIVLDWISEDYEEMIKTSDNPKYSNTVERLKKGDCYIDCEVDDLCNEYVQGLDGGLICLARKKDDALTFWIMDLRSFMKEHFPNSTVVFRDFWFNELDAEDRSKIYDREAREVSREEFMEELGLENIGAA